MENHEKIIKMSNRASDNFIIEIRRNNFNNNFKNSLKWNLNEHEQDRLNEISEYNLMMLSTHK
jgi:hypothetical protein